MFFAFRAVGHTYVVSGASMEPTFHDAEMVVVNRLAYRSFDLSWLPGVDVDAWRPFGEPQRGDVVVFEFPDNPERDFIKRVIGVPGDRVEVRDLLVYVNGAALDEPYIQDPPRGGYPATTVPPAHVFVLGDNRNNSSDSRSWGMLPQSSIIGRADVRYWPLDELGMVGHAEAEGFEVSPSP
ncbi:MAG: signal peptidase I [Dehalococcoidia bacterium]|nr:signal peptidase I [Dehalococcoidia bacterium]